MSHGLGILGVAAVGMAIAFAVATVVAWIIVAIVVLIWLFVLGIKRASG